MTLQTAQAHTRPEIEVGVRELHDHLSEYLEKVADDTVVVVTRRGKPLARIDKLRNSALEQLIADGLARPPLALKGEILPPVKASGSISELVKQQRR